MSKKIKESPAERLKRIALSKTMLQKAKPSAKTYNRQKSESRSRSERDSFLTKYLSIISKRQEQLRNWALEQFLELVLCGSHDSVRRAQR